jgi:uncharacterized protein
METFLRHTRIEAPADEVFRWHCRPGAFERLTPPWEPVRVAERTGGVENGSRVALRVGLGPIRIPWVAEHRDVVEGRGFRDVQVRGPFARWEHTHLFEPEGPDACRLVDEIRYALPLEPMGALVAGRTVRKRLDRVFAYRHEVTRQDVAAHAAHGGEGLRVLVTGSTGLVGSALVPALTAGGYEVTRLVRRPARAEGEVEWDPAAGTVDIDGLEGHDAAVHLAGESIAGRWTPARKKAIRRSRVDGTRILASVLASLESPPEVLVCASALGYYGDRGEELLTEQSPAGAGFLPEVCREWEAAADAAAARRIRVVHLRLGLVLSPAGGALRAMLPAFRLGLGGRLGTGSQWMSWIGLDDVLDVVLHAIHQRSLAGPVNAVAPGAVRNVDFTRILGGVLGRPTLAAVPAAAARLAFGEMAEALLLASSRVAPERLQASGCGFRHPELEGALRHVLGRRPRGTPRAIQP